tara:strand:+ start:4219 stop:4602 length:384 start_codon:yes stop_codon:yes gene_type:complete
MLEEIPVLYEILWASIGVVLYIFSCRVLNYSLVIALYKEATIRCLVMLATLNGDIEFILKTKYETMETCDLPEEHIKTMKKMDEVAMDHWRNNVIANMINCLPRKFQSVIGFSSWDQAVQKINKIKK